MPTIRDSCRVSSDHAAIHEQGGRWRALLGGALRERALEVVEDITDNLRADEPPSGDWDVVADPSLAGGAAGLAVLFAYWAVARSGADDESAADRWLDRAINAVSEQPMGASLYGGLTGVGWAAAHGSVDPAALSLFLIVFLWQAPHFLAIAWIYRDQYARAGLRVLPVVALDKRPMPTNWFHPANGARAVRNW